MSSTYIHPPADPGIANIVEQLSRGLEELPVYVEHLTPALAQGITPGQLRGITPDDYAALYRVAHQLCDAGDFHHALVIGLQLVFNDPTHARYAFLAATCLQRLRRWQEAALLYALTLDLEEDHAAAAFRLGQCLAASGKTHEASDMLEKSIALSRGNAERRELLLLAEQALSQLRSR